MLILICECQGTAVNRGWKRSVDDIETRGAEEAGGTDARNEKDTREALERVTVARRRYSCQAIVVKRHQIAGGENTERGDIAF